MLSGAVRATGIIGGIVLLPNEAATPEIPEGAIVRVNPETGELEIVDPLEGTKKETLDQGPVVSQVPPGPQSPIGPGEEPPLGGWRDRLKRAIKNIIDLIDADFF